MKNAKKIVEKLRKKMRKRWKVDLKIKEIVQSHQNWEKKF